MTAVRTAVGRWRLLTLRDLRRNKGRAAATVAVVAAATTLLVTVLTILTSLEHSISATREAVVGSAVVQIIAHSGAGMDSVLQGEIAGVPGVLSAVPVVNTEVVTPGGALPLLATDRTGGDAGSALASGLSAKAGALLSAPNAVLAGPGTGLKAGDVFDAGASRANVVDVLDGPGFTDLAGGRYLVSSLPVAQRVTGRPDTVDAFLVLLADGADRQAVQDAVTDEVAGRAAVTDPDAGGGGKGVTLIRLTALSAAALSFLVAGFLVYTVVVMALAQRRRTLSIQRALGARFRTLAGDSVAETCLLALIGGLLGTAAGLAVGAASISRLPALFLMGVTGSVSLHVSWWVPVFGVGAAVVIGAIATLLAARRVREVSPVEALSPVEVSAVDSVPAHRRIIAGGIGTALVAAGFAVAAVAPGITANAGISVLFAGLILSAWALAGMIVAATAFLARRFGIAGALAAQSAERAPRRTWATVMTVAVAVGASFAIAAGNTNAVDAATRSAAGLGAADIRVEVGAPGGLALGAPLPGGVAEDVSAVPGVSSSRNEYGLFGDVGGSSVMIFGLASGSVHPLAGAGSAGTAPVSSAPAPPDDTVRAVVSRDIAEERGWIPGDTFSLPTPTGHHEVQVVEIVPFFSALNGAIAVDAAILSDWFQLDRPTALQVGLAPGVDPERAVADIQASLPPGVQASTGQQTVTEFTGALGQATALNNLIWMVVMVIGAISVFTTLSLAVLDRRREIGMIRAMGAGRRLVTRSVLVESAAVATVGGVLGLIFGFAEQVLAAMASSRAWGVDVLPWPVPLAFGMGVLAALMCMAGGVLPALRATSVPVVEAIGNPR